MTTRNITSQLVHHSEDPLNLKTFTRANGTFFYVPAQLMDLVPKSPSWWPFSAGHRLRYTYFHDSALRMADINFTARESRLSIDKEKTQVHKWLVRLNNNIEEEKQHLNKSRLKPTWFNRLFRRTALRFSSGWAQQLDALSALHVDLLTRFNERLVKEKPRIVSERLQRLRPTSRLVIGRRHVATQTDDNDSRRVRSAGRRTSRRASPSTPHARHGFFDRLRHPTGGRVSGLIQRIKHTDERVNNLSIK